MNFELRQDLAAVKPKVRDRIIAFYRQGIVSGRRNLGRHTDGNRTEQKEQQQTSSHGRLLWVRVHSRPFQQCSSLRHLRVLCVSAVNPSRTELTADTQRPRREKLESRTTPNPFLGRSRRMYITFWLGY